MLEPVVHISNLNLRYHQKMIFEGLEWTIRKGENCLLSGESGTGKTSLAKVIAGLQQAIGDVTLNFDNTSTLPAKAFYVESWYQFKNLEGVANFYYQQRYTSQQVDDTLTVKADLLLFAKENNIHFDNADPILRALNFSSVLESQLIELSSGERKKLQLIKALWLSPQLLIIDQPYTGLDAASRQNLNVLLNRAAIDGVTLILIGNDNDLPACISHFAQLKDGKIVESSTQDLTSALTAKEPKQIPDFLQTSPVYSTQQLVKMVDVNISYGEKKVLENINWEVKAGEKWLLNGHNGSGKSTLLSLITGDHPQSYANEIYLFGKKRGSGESIWDIKQHIGLISPEFHWYFDTTATVWQTIASGIYDTVGLFSELPYTKSVQVDSLIEYFGFTEDKNALLTSLPLGKQRLVLLARTIIKNPELLILDEPCQGLDHQQTEYFNHFLDELCNNGMTLIYVGHFDTALPACLEKKLTLENGRVTSLEETIYRQQEVEIAEENNLAAVWQ